MIMSSERHTLYIKDGKSLCHVTYLSTCLLYMEGAEQTKRANEKRKPEGEKKRRDKEARKGHEERKQIECRQVKEPRK